MSAATIVAATPLPTFSGVLASEWTKLTSLRSPYWLGALTVAASGGLTSVGATASSVDPGFQPVGSLSDGVLLAQIFPLVLGVLVGTGEYSTGAFRATFTAVPRRLPVLAAQALTTAAFALVVACLSVGAAVLGLLPAARSRGMALGLGADEAPQVMAGMALFLVGVALLGLAIGALLRRSVPAVTTAVVLMLVLPVVLSLASDLGGPPMTEGPAAVSPANIISTFLPSGGWLLMMPSDSDGYDGAPSIGPWGGGLVLLAWTVGLLAVAAARLRTRDAV
jgi:ABC-2 type transport system permease protein